MKRSLKKGTLPLLALLLGAIKAIPVLRDEDVVNRTWGWVFLVAAVLMIFAAAIEAWIGVAAERRSLEHIAVPLSSKGL